MRFLPALWLFARTQFARSLQLRRNWLIVLFTLFPAVVGFVLSQTVRGATSLDIAVNLAWFLFLQVVVPLVALLAGTGVIAREVDDRTITYLFSRPVSRSAAFLGRTLGALAFVLLLLLLGAVLLLVAVAHMKSGKTAGPELFPLAPWTQDGVSVPFFGAVALGVVAYTSLFAALGTFTKHPMIFGLAYAFAIETFLSNLPGSNQAATVQFYLRSWVTARGGHAWTTIEGFGPASFDPAHLVLWKLGIASVALLALGAWRIRRRQFVLSS